LEGDMERENIIFTKSITFSGKIINFTRKLKQIQEFDLSRQLFKSGTSIGANIHEAQSAESKTDFIHKLKIADKEAEETKYWLILIIENFDFPESNEIMEELKEIKRILGKIIATSKK
jgi:four helix bundle protein